MKKLLFTVTALLAACCACAAGCNAEKPDDGDDKPYGIIQETPEEQNDGENQNRGQDLLITPRAPAKPDSLQRIADGEEETQPCPDCRMPRKRRRRGGRQPRKPLPVNPNRYIAH